MLNYLRFLAKYILLLLCLYSCAKQGSISGGPKDETPPKLVKATPPNYSTHFKEKEVRIYFDELITLENPQQQIIISPPMNTKPEISPLGVPSKLIKIKFLDTLQAQTTYTINFGSSVVDFNEKNPFTFFQYVFSTGNVLDSLQFNGSIKDAINQKLEKDISVFLYEVNEKHNDSLVYKVAPRYIANTLDSTLFKFENLKAGTYQLVAVKDKNRSYTYQPSQDKIAFKSDFITIPRDSTAHLTLFKEASNFKFSRAKQVSKNHFIIGYQGEINSPEIEVLKEPFNNQIKTRFFKDKQTDTLNVFVTPFFEQDSIVFKLKANTLIDTLVARYKDQHKDSLKIDQVSNSTLQLKENFVITANTPIGLLNKEKVFFVDQDTVPVSFTQKWNSFKNEITIQFDKKEESYYAFQLFPGAITDFLGNTNDSLVFNLETKKISEYGKLVLSFSGINEWPLIVQLLKSPNKVYDENILESPNTTITFESVNPADYSIRIIKDTNKNGKWDTGNYLKKIQPEEVIFYPKPITIRANWDVKQLIKLNE